MVDVEAIVRSFDNPDETRTSQRGRFEIVRIGGLNARLKGALVTVKQIAAVFIYLSILLVSGTATAQGLQAGVQGGVSFNSLSNLRNAIDFGGPVDIKRRTGVAAGPFIAFPMNETLALQLEALFVTKGATPTDGTNELKIRLAYIDLPVLLRLSPPSMRRFYFLFGPSLNVNVSAKTIDVVPTGAEEDIKDDIRNAEFGLVFGAGLSPRNILVEARYSAGLSDIADSRRITGVQITAPVRNRAFAVLVGMRF